MEKSLIVFFGSAPQFLHGIAVIINEVGIARLFSQVLVVVNRITDNLRFILIVKDSVNIAVIRVVFVNIDALKRPARIKRLVVNVRDVRPDIDDLKRTVAVKRVFVNGGDELVVVVGEEIHIDILFVLNAARD